MILEAERAGETCEHPAMFIGSPAPYFTEMTRDLAELVERLLPDLPGDVARA